MAEYIEREEINKAMKEVCDDPSCPMHVAAEIAQIIDCAPAADVVTVVHGRWLHSGCEECSGLEVVKCSECNHEAFAIAFYVCNGNYCPSCGARMDGGVDNG